MPKLNEHLMSLISLTIIASVFTYRLLNAFMEYIIIPIINILIDPNEDISSLNFTFHTGKNHRDKKIFYNPDIDTGSSPSYDIMLGTFIKEIIIWLIVMTVIYYCS